MTRKTGLAILICWAFLMSSIYFYGMDAKQKWKAVEATCVAKGGIHIKVDGETVCAKVEILK